MYKEEGWRKCKENMLQPLYLRLKDCIRDSLAKGRRVTTIVVGNYQKWFKEGASYSNHHIIAYAI